MNPIYICQELILSDECTPIKNYDLENLLYLYKEKRRSHFFQISALISRYL